MRSSSIGRQPCDSRAQSALFGVRLLGSDPASLRSLQVETDRLRDPDERDPPQHLTGIPALPTGRSCRLEQPLALIEAQCRGGEAGASRHLTDGQLLLVHPPNVRHLPLDLKSTSTCTVLPWTPDRDALRCPSSSPRRSTSVRHAPGRSCGFVRAPCAARARRSHRAPSLRLAPRARTAARASDRSPRRPTSVRSRGAHAPAPAPSSRSKHRPPSARRRTRAPAISTKSMSLRPGSGRHASSARLAPLLADLVVPSLAAAAHGPIFLFQMPRVAPRGELTGELLRPLARELGRNPELEADWFEARGHRAPSRPRGGALRRAARNAAPRRSGLRLHLSAHVAGRGPGSRASCSLRRRPVSTSRRRPE